MEWLDRFVQVMDVLSSREYCRGIGITDLSEKTEISKSTLHRMLQNMSDQKLVIQNAETRKYELGPRSMMWGSQFIRSRNIDGILSRYCRMLADDTGLYSFLCRFSGDQVYCIAVKQPREENHMYFVNIGQVMPWHCSACAKAILAFQSPEYINCILAKEKKVYTEYTITEPERLKDELRTVRQRGIAWCNEEMEYHVAAAGVPLLFHGEGAVFSLGFVGNDTFIKEHRSKLESVLLKWGSLAGKELSLARELTGII
jgi:DNA-binding IclR family transcriptional regulator